MSDPAKDEEQMTLFRKAGYEVLMDDFGSADPLATLRDFDFDEIKIDMGFMRNFSDKSKKIIRPMIMLAQSLDVHTLTEAWKPPSSSASSSRLAAKGSRATTSANPFPTANSSRN